MTKVLALFLLLQSCVSIRMDDSVDLGSKYRYIQDYPQSIIYHEAEEYEGVGIEVVTPIVKSYEFNDRYIIARSLQIDMMTGNKLGTPDLYWIIDKSSTTKPQVSSMDSARFYEQLEELEIDLELN